jgi:hypothetical protein
LPRARRSAKREIKKCEKNLENFFSIGGGGPLASARPSPSKSQVAAFFFDSAAATESQSLGLEKHLSNSKPKVLPASHYYSIFNRGEYFGLTEAVFATVSAKKSRLIVA